MSLPQYETATPGVVRVSGELTFDTIPGFEAETRALFANPSTTAALTIDLGGVQRADSAGVALLIEWLRHAQTQGKPLRFENIPQQMLAIARLSGVEGLITPAAPVR